MRQPGQLSRAGWRGGAKGVDPTAEHPAGRPASSEASTRCRHHPHLTWECREGRSLSPLGHILIGSRARERLQSKAGVTWVHPGPTGMGSEQMCRPCPRPPSRLHVTFSPWTSHHQPSCRAAPLGPPRTQQDLPRSGTLALPAPLRSSTLLHTSQLAPRTHAVSGGASHPREGSTCINT